MLTFVSLSCGKATADFRENLKGLMINDEELVIILPPCIFPQNFI